MHEGPEQSSVVILRISGEKLILAAGFAPSFLKIMTVLLDNKTIYYADHKFTDDTLSGKLRELKTQMQVFVGIK